MHAPAVAYSKRRSGERPVVKAILDAIRDARSILVTAHARPDGDAVGSVLACGMMLEQLGKQVTMAFSDRVPLIYRWLPCAQSIQHWQQVEGDFDLVILLECDGIERSRLKGLEGRRLINIDHHTSGRNFAHLNWIDTDAARSRSRSSLWLRRRCPHHARDGHLSLHGRAHRYRFLLLRRHGCAHVLAGA